MTFAHGSSMLLTPLAFLMLFEEMFNIDSSLKAFLTGGYYFLFHPLCGLGANIIERSCYRIRLKGFRF